MRIVAPVAVSAHSIWRTTKSNSASRSSDRVYGAGRAASSLPNATFA